jgi:GGDEF domain-containing protein
VLDVTIANYVGIALINLASAAALYLFQRTHRLRAASLSTSIILLKRADVALYQAKANGRNRVERAAEAPATT